MLIGIAGTLFSACFVGFLVFRRLFLATFFTLLGGFSIFAIDTSEIERNRIRIRLDTQNMLPNCMAVITVTLVGLKFVDKFVALD
jgi:hypothetical protein